MVLKLSCASESPGGPLKHRCVGPSPQSLTQPGAGLENWPSHKFPRDDAAGLAATLKAPPYPSIGKKAKMEGSWRQKEEKGAWEEVLWDSVGRAVPSVETVISVVKENLRILF